MHDAVQHWDLSSMAFKELCSQATVLFVAKVLMAASLVAFGPALVLEYVPTKKVDVGDMASAGSKAGRTQRLLLAFAGGGLMAEGALHLLPHLFMPPHDSSAHGGTHDSHHHDDQGGVDVYSLIAVGFLAAFAIDRFVGSRRKEAGGKTIGFEEIDTAVSAAVAPASAGEAAATAEGSSHRGREIEATDAGVGDGEAGGEGPPAVGLVAAAATVADEAAAPAVADEVTVTVAAPAPADGATVTAAAAVVGAADATSSVSAAEGGGNNGGGGGDVAEASPAAGAEVETAPASSTTVVDENSCVVSDEDHPDVAATSLADQAGGDADSSVSPSPEGTAVANPVDGAAANAGEGAPVAVTASATAEENEEEDKKELAPLEAVGSTSAEHGDSVPGSELAAAKPTRTPGNSPTAGVCTDRAAAFGAPDGAYQFVTDAAADFVEKDTGAVADTETEAVRVESGDDSALAPELASVAKPADEPVGPEESGGHVEPAETSEPAQSAESAESAKPAESAESAKPAESAEPEEPVEPVEPAERTESAESAEPAEPVEPVEPAEPAEPVEPVEPAEPEEPVEPAEPAESVEPRGLEEPAESTEFPELIESAEPAAFTESDEPVEPAEPTKPAVPADSTGEVEEIPTPVLLGGAIEEPTAPETPSEAAASSEPMAAEPAEISRHSNPRTDPGEVVGEGDGLEADALAANGTSEHAATASANTSDDVAITGHAVDVASTAVGGEDGHIIEAVNGGDAAATSPAAAPTEDADSAVSHPDTESAGTVKDTLESTGTTMEDASESTGAMEDDPESTGTMKDGPEPTGTTKDSPAALPLEGPTEEPDAPGTPHAAATHSEPTSTEDLGLTRYGNPRTVPGEAAGDGEGLKAGPVTTGGTSRDAPAPAHTIDDVTITEHAALVKSGGDAHSGGGGGGHHDDHHDGHHGDHHGDAEAGAYVTLAVDFLHNVIDGIGIGGAYALGGDATGHATAILKLIHEIQHEVGDVATLVQCGMSKHHAIHIQHTTAAGVFLGVAISLGASAFPEGLLSACLALSAGATFHLASGTVLGPVLAIPANVGGATHAFLEVAALAAGAAGVVAVGVAEKWAGLGH